MKTPPKPKICMISLSPIIYDSRVQNEANTLLQAGYDVSVTVVDDQEYNNSIPDPEKAYAEYLKRNWGITTTRIWLRSRTWRRIPKPLRRFFLVIELCFKLSVQVIRNRANVYHSHDLKPAIFCLLGKYLYGAKLVYDAHEFEVDQIGLTGFAKRLLTLYEKKVVRAAHLRITVNESIASAMQQAYKREIEVVENMPKHELADISDTSAFSLIRSLPAGSKLLMYVGYLNPYRGIYEMIRALQLLPPHYYFLILGNGRISAFKQTTDALIREIDLKPERVRYLEPVSPNQVVSVLSLAHISVVLISRKLGLHSANNSPNKLYQSIVADVPILAANHGLFPKHIHHPQYGSFGEAANEEDPQEIAGTILGMTDAERYKKYKDNLAKAKPEFNWEHQAKRLVNAYGRMFKPI